MDFIEPQELIEEYYCAECGYLGDAMGHHEDDLTLWVWCPVKWCGTVAAHDPEDYLSLELA